MRIPTFCTWIRRSRTLRLGPGAALLGVLAVHLLSCGSLQAQATVTTLGGGSATKPYSGYVDGTTLTQAEFNTPAGMALDPSGTVLFIADYGNNAIRMVSQVGVTATSVTLNPSTEIVRPMLGVAPSGGAARSGNTLPNTADARRQRMPSACRASANLDLGRGRPAVRPAGRSSLVVNTARLPGSA